MAAVLLAEAFAKLWDRYGKRWKEYVIWTWGCIFALGMDLILPVFALALYRWKKPELMALSGSFIARFQLPGMFLEAHGLSWFGSPYDPGIYDYLDMMFAYLEIVIFYDSAAAQYGRKRAPESFVCLPSGTAWIGFLESGNWEIIRWKRTVRNGSLDLQ